MPGHGPYSHSMTPTVAEVLQSAKSLTPDQIAELACQLLLILDEDPGGAGQQRAGAAWRAEFRRRIDDIESGSARLVSHEETVSLARGMLAARDT